MHKCLVAYIRLAGMLDTHPCFISPFCLHDRPLQSTLEPRNRSTPEATTMTSSSPLTRSRSVDPRHEASPFRSVSLMLFVLAFLRQNLTNYVCTQILVCITLYSGPCDPLIL